MAPLLSGVVVMKSDFAAALDAAGITIPGIIAFIVIIVILMLILDPP